MWWGVSYEGCSANPVSGYTRQQLRLDTDYRYKMLPGFYLGATLNLNYTRALNMGAPEYLEGQKDSYYFTGLGLFFQYDTRDTPWTLREEPGPFSLPLRSSTREGFSRTTGLVSASSSSTG